MFTAFMTLTSFQPVVYTVQREECESAVKSNKPFDTLKNDSREQSFVLEHVRAKQLGSIA